MSNRSCRQNRNGRPFRREHYTPNDRDPGRVPPWYKRDEDDCERKVTSYLYTCAQVPVSVQQHGFRRKGYNRFNCTCVRASMRIRRIAATVEPFENATHLKSYEKERDSANIVAQICSANQIFSAHVRVLHQTTSLDGDNLLAIAIAVFGRYHGSQHLPTSPAIIS